ncbi:MAG: SRPBCC domain-containing protein [Myxococcota bacterium]
MKTISHRIYVAAKPAAVFAALTKPEGVAALYFGSRLETSFEPGSPYRYVGPDGKGGEAVHVEGEVLACVPEQRFAVTHRAGPLWRTGPKVFQSRVTYALEDLGFATKLTVTQDELEDGDPGYEHNLEGWNLFLSSLKSWVETGRALQLPV